MGTLQAIAGVPAGRRAKWAVLVCWLIIVAVAGPLAGKLTRGGEERLLGLASGQGRIDQGP